MTREDIDNIISIICPNDEDFEKPIISPAYLKKELETLAIEQEPSGDLISRQAVLDLISKFILEIHSEGGRDLNAHTNDVLRQILRNIGSDRVLPSVNPQERTGHWIEGQTNNPNIHNILCSCCFEGYPSKGHANSQYTREKFKYCPNCGARMVEKPRVRIGNNTYYY